MRQNFFEQMQKTAVSFISPSNLCHTWSGANYISGGENCFQIELLVKGHADRIYKTYKDYVKYLLSEERNSIYTFRSSNQLWDNATKINRRHEADYIENRPAKDKELLFCLSLGLDKEVLARLNKLRQRDPATSMTHFGQNEIQALESYLEKINEHLAAVKNTEQDPRKIPRRMLLEANIYLLKLGLKPIIPLSDEEINELNTLLCLREMRDSLDTAYFETFDKDGKRLWTFKTHQLLIAESIRLLKNGQPPMTELSSDDICRLILDEKINEEDALRFYYKTAKTERWIIKRGVQLIPNNNLTYAD